MAKADENIKPKTHPTYEDMIIRAINHLQAARERKGSSRQAIFKYIIDHYSLEDNDATIRGNLRRALNHGIETEKLSNTSGTGANGHFRVNNDLKLPRVQKVVKPATATKKPTLVVVSGPSVSIGLSETKATEKADVGPDVGPDVRALTPLCHNWHGASGIAAMSPRM